jgi:hypothetical protein
VRLGRYQQHVVERQPFAGELLVERQQALEFVPRDVYLGQKPIVAAPIDSASS